MYTNVNILHGGEHTRPGCCARRLAELPSPRIFAPFPSRHFAPRTSLQPVDLTFLTLFNLKNSLPNPLISRVCTPFHINQFLFSRRLFLHSRFAALKFPTTSPRLGLGSPENLIIIRYLSHSEIAHFLRKPLSFMGLTGTSLLPGTKNYHMIRLRPQPFLCRQIQRPSPPPPTQAAPGGRRLRVNLIGNL